MSAKEETTQLPGPSSSAVAENLEEQEAMDAATSKLTMDFGMGQQAPERITIEVLKQLIRESPKQMAYALNQPIQASLRRSAVLLLLVGEDAARIIMTELGAHEKALLASSVAGLSPASLGEQTTTLKEFTENALQANASLFGNPEFAKDITTPAIPQTTSEPRDLSG